MVLVFLTNIACLLITTSRLSMTGVLRIDWIVGISLYIAPVG